MSKTFFNDIVWAAVCSPCLVLTCLVFISQAVEACSLEDKILSDFVDHTRFLPPADSECQVEVTPLSLEDFHTEMEAISFQAMELTLVEPLAPSKSSPHIRSTTDVNLSVPSELAIERSINLASEDSLEELPPEVSVADRVTAVANISTLGPGVAAVTPILPNLNARANFNALPGGIGFNFTTEEVDYDAKLNLLSLSAGVDYYPFGPESVFYISGGLGYQNNRISGSGEPNFNQEITIDGVVYTTDQVGALAYEAFFQNSIAPYFGIGIGSPVAVTENRISFFANIGLMYVGLIDVSLRATAPDPAIADQLQQNIDNEIASARQSIRDSYSFPFYPVVTLGVAYSF